MNLSHIQPTHSTVVDFAKFSWDALQNRQQYLQLVQCFKICHQVIHQYNPQTLTALRLLMSQRTPILVEDDRWLQRFATIVSANDQFGIPKDFVLMDSELFMFYYFMEKEGL